MTLVAEQLRAALPALPRAERRVAHEILASYPTAGLETVARLADRADVSGPTVIRLVSRLGYAGFPEFQQALIDEIQERTASPLHQYARRAVDGHTDALTTTIRVLVENVSGSLSQLDPATFAGAVELLADPRRRLRMAGGRFSSIIARCLAQHLEILRPDARFLDGTDWVSYLLDARKGDVVVVVDVRRYQESTIDFGRECVRRGASVVLITDPWMSPLAVDSDIVLPVAVQSSSPFDSQVAALALVEALVAGVVDKGDFDIPARVRDYDTLWAAQGFSEPSSEG